MDRQRVEIFAAYVVQLILIGVVLITIFVKFESPMTNAITVLLFLIVQLRISDVVDKLN